MKTKIGHEYMMTRTIDSSHRCLRVRCDDGSVSYPLLNIPDYWPDGTRAPEPPADLLEKLVDEYFAAEMGATRIPDCPSHHP